jgi:hypothetical protein
MLAEERVNGKELDKEAARQAVTTYENLFETWRKLKYDNPCCPTLYTDYDAKWCGIPDYESKWLGPPPFQEVLQPLKKRLGMN